MPMPFPLDVLNVKQLGASGNGDDSESDCAAIQHGIDLILKSGCGGKLYFPPGVYLLKPSNPDPSADGLSIPRAGGRIILQGDGSLWDDANKTASPSALGAATTLIYEGIGAAIRVGDAANTLGYTFGVEIRDLHFLGRDPATHLPPGRTPAKGVFFDGTTNNGMPVPNPESLAARCSMEKVSVRGFDVGVHLCAPVSFLCRRVFAVANGIGLLVDGAYSSVFDNVVCRQNDRQGMVLNDTRGAVSNVTITGQSLFEGNDSEGVLIRTGYDDDSGPMNHMGNVTIEHARFGANNGVNTDSNYALCVRAGRSAPGRIGLLRLCDIAFASEGGAGAYQRGDMSIDHVTDCWIQDIISATPDNGSNKLLEVGSNASGVSLWNVRGSPAINDPHNRIVLRFNVKGDGKLTVSALTVP
jgi:hypothetical protein